MSKLVTLNETNNEEVLSKIFDNDIVVYEDIQGAKIWVNWNGKNFEVKPKNLKSDALNLIDLSLQKFYNSAVNYFNIFDSRVKGLMPRNWWFGFEYFPDNQPANIEYSKIPKNGLVLCSINKSGKFNYSIDELREYARLFNVDHLPVIFEGKLSDGMKEAIKYFLNTSTKDLEYVFGEKSFAFFFYKILNPNLTNSFLMNDDFQKNVQKLIIRIIEEEIGFEILNPLYTRISNENSTEYTDIYTLILISFLTFCQSVDIDQLKIKGKTRDEAYIYLVCKMYNMYVTEVKDDLMNFNFIIPEFFDRDKFKINKELLSNKMTKDLISESPKLEYIFKVILGSFSKRRTKPIGVFTDATCEQFNNYVDKISTHIDFSLKKMREMDIAKSGLLDFQDFFDIEYDQDSTGDVYPSAWEEIERSSGGKKNKKEGEIFNKK